MTLGKQQELFSRNFCKLLQFIFEKGYEVRIGEVLRTAEQQQIYIKMGRSKTMNSQHLKKLAVDLYITKDGVIVYPDEVFKYWESLDPDNNAGAYWKTFVDKPHFEYKP